MLLPLEVTFARFALASLRHRGDTARTCARVLEHLADALAARNRLT